MPNVSTGLGFAILGGSILSAAIVSRMPAGTAAAQGPAGLAAPHRAEQLHRRPTNIAAIECQLPPETWLSPTPHVAQLCSGNLVGLSNLGSADLNRDGTLEHFGPYSFEWNAVSQGAVTAEILDFYRVQFGSSGGQLQSTRCLQLGPSCANQLRALLPGAQSILVGVSRYGMMDYNGWADCDSDGDLDLALVMTASFGSYGGYYYLWFENIGMPVLPPSNPYDLDADGHVNTADLSLLLMEFTD
jgi:hypothetical protein